MIDKAREKLKDMDFENVTWPQAFVILLIFLFISEVGQVVLFGFVFGILFLLWKVFAP